jgi:hypothetical protein
MASQPGTLISSHEKRIFVALGYLVVRWNYAEHFVRQLLRRDIGTDAILEPASIKVSNRRSSDLSRDLRALANTWSAREGEPFIKGLDEAFRIAVDHRNHFVHGAWMTVTCGDPETAMAVMSPSMIKDSRLELPSHVPVEVFEATAHYFHDLGLFARAVCIGFNGDGTRAHDEEGQNVIPELPPVIEPLPAIERHYYSEMPHG